MKTFNQYINEGTEIKYKYHPHDIESLNKCIRKEIKAHGYDADLNCIDVSGMTTLAGVFHDKVWDPVSISVRKFTGDISNWDVSNVTNMVSMFVESKFNNDISDWDVSNVVNMAHMFVSSEFNGDISRWNVSNVTEMSYMLTGAAFEGDISRWQPCSLKTVTSDIALNRKDAISQWLPYIKHSPTKHFLEGCVS